MFKKFFPYLAVIVLSVCLFISGFYFGIHMFSSMKSTTIFQDNFIQSTQLISVLNYLDEGKEEQARQYLLLNLDASILAINALAAHADKQSYETACNILNGVAKHRKDNPVKYSAYTYSIEKQQTPDIRKEVALVLHNWESCKK